MNKEAAYDRTMNEGGEGYNPHRAAREEREIEDACKAPRTRYDVLRALETEDCSIARESGTYDAARVAELRAELAAMDKAEAEAFASVWTRETTEARRAAWNAEGRKLLAAHGNRIPASEIYALRKRLGYGIDEIKRAKALHGIA
jgi:hypothetical protein